MEYTNKIGTVLSFIFRMRGVQPICTDRQRMNKLFEMIDMARENQTLAKPAF